MTVGSICKRKAVTILRSDDLTAAALKMREEHVGYLVVVEPETANKLKVIGVLTDRDIVVSVVAREVDPRSLSVADVMTPDPVTVREDAPIPEALVKMRRVGVRRLPVLTSTDELRGVISLDDVLDTISFDLRNVSGSINNEQKIEKARRP